jgi:hypothetical protein
MNKQDYGVIQKSTTALAASLVVKASPGSVFDVLITNTLASAQFIQIHDAASLPDDTSVPETSIRIPASSSASITFDDGKSMTTGIVVCNSSTTATKTIGAADCWFEVTYQ